MREFINKIKLKGILSLSKFEFENVICEYEEDIYSNKKMYGFYEVDYLPAEYQNNWRNYKEFIFISNETNLNGRINGLEIELGSNGTHKIHFRINEVIESSFINENKPKYLQIIFKIPYISYLARDVKSYWDFDEDFIAKFDSDEFKVEIDDIKINFNEIIYFIKYNDPDSIFNRMIYPIIKIELEKSNNEYINEKINYLEYCIEDVLAIISLLLFKKFHIFGYTVELFDESNKLTNRIIYKSTKKICGEDFIDDKSDIELEKYFNSTNITALIQRFHALNNENKEKYLRILYGYLTIGDLKIFEPQFRDAYFVLCAISKIILNPLCDPGSEGLIKGACELAKINLENYNFEKSIKSNKLDWLITEYRNELTHYNFDLEYDKELLHKEFSKMMNLLRELMIYYLESSLMHFPYPNQMFNYTV